MTDLLLPRTDAGVLAQVVVLAAVFALALWAARRNRDAMVFVGGVAVFTAGLVALRTLH